MALENNSPTFTYCRWTGMQITYNETIYAIIDSYTDDKYIYWNSASPYELKSTNVKKEVIAGEFLIIFNDNGLTTMPPYDDIIVDFDGNNPKKVEGSIYAMYESMGTLGDRFSSVESDLDKFETRVGIVEKDLDKTENRVSSIEQTSEKIDLEVKKVTKSYEESALRDSLNKSIIDSNATLGVFKSEMSTYIKNNGISVDEKNKITAHMTKLEEAKGNVLTEIDKLLEYASKKNEKTKLTDAKNKYVRDIDNLKTYITTAISDNTIVPSEITGIISMFGAASSSTEILKNTCDTILLLGSGGSIISELAKIGISSNEISLKVENVEEQVKGTVSDIDVMYYQSNSTTELVGGTWVTTCPTWKVDKYIWTKTVTTYKNGDTFESPVTCISGRNGLDGVPGTDGKPGANAPTKYTWVRYATSSSGANMSNSPVGKTYIGLAYNKDSATESTIASDYAWSLIKGDKGDTGIQGKPGADGRPKYTWVRYSDYSNGNPNYDTPKSSTKYIGLATNKDDAAESTTASHYVWSKFIGDNGTGVVSVTEEYYLSNSKTTQSGGGWVTSPPTWVKGKYMWTRNKIVYENPSSTTYTKPVVDTSWEVANDVANDLKDLDDEYRVTVKKVSDTIINLDSITNRVSATEKVANTANSTANTAISKLTKNSLTTTIGSYYTTSSQVEGQITSKKYQTESQVQQTVNSWSAKFTESGGQNLIKNSYALNGESNWTAYKYDGTNTYTTLSCWKDSFWGQYDNMFNIRALNANTYTETGYKQRIRVVAGREYTLRCLIAGHRTEKRIEITNGAEDAMITTSAVYGHIHGVDYWEECIIHFTPTDSHIWLRLCILSISASNENDGYFWLRELCMVEGSIPSKWSPHPSELYDGITTIDKDGIKVESTATDTHTRMDSSSFRVESTGGGTVAEFSTDSTIPSLSSTDIVASNISAPNIIQVQNSVTYYVDLKYGNDTNDGLTVTSELKTIQEALNRLNKYIPRGNTVTINIENTDTQTVIAHGFLGGGILKFHLLNGTKLYCSQFDILRCTCGVYVTSEKTSYSSTTTGQIINGNSGTCVYVAGCPNVTIEKICIVGNETGYGVTSNSSHVYVGESEISRFTSCLRAEKSGYIGCYKVIGSDVDYLMSGATAGCTFVEEYSSAIVPNYTEALNHSHGTYAKIGLKSGGKKTSGVTYGASVTPPAPPAATQKVTVWEFDKIWSDETLKGYSNRAELIQGYASKWKTGRWTGYMQRTDGFSDIREQLSGASNLSGRLYLVRKSSAGNGADSLIHLYASDGTTVTTTTKVDWGEDLWIPLSSSICGKIKSGAITYFYLKANDDNTATYIRFTNEVKIEITYTK